MTITTDEDGTRQVVALASPASARPAWQRAVQRGAVAVALALPLAALTGWIASAREGIHLDQLGATSTAVVPAVGRQMQASGPRILQVADAGPDTVTWALLRADGTSLLDGSVLAQGADAGRAELGVLVGELLSGQGQHVAEALAATGVGAVQTPATSSLDLIATLDLTDGLERVTDGEVLLWRIDREVTLVTAPAPPPLRGLWLGGLGVITVVYLAVSLPTGRRRGK
ncbi:MAG: hypothetical protein FWG11_08430 [Promicromonosporaceae bacterium]|nr:hypothetical protein [Promicromonosporaceae bacterium]